MRNAIRKLAAIAGGEESLKGILGLFLEEPGEPMNVDDLRILTAVAKNGSMNRAAAFG